MNIADSYFEISGTKIPKLIGRKYLIESAKRHLCKESPNNISFIGPKYIGKSSFLAGMAQLFENPETGYFTTIYFDLRHNSPRSDADYFKELAKLLVEKIRPIDAELADLINNETNDYDNIKAIFQLLESDKKRVLLILDGIDSLLKSSSITKNLWDNLRSLGNLGSCTIVTGSRKRLRELCSSTDSKTSDFWNIFYETPFVVGPFNDSDIDCVKDIFSGIDISFDKGAEKELRNWTGLNPLLVCMLCNQIQKETPSGAALSSSDINEIAKLAQEANKDHLEALWEANYVEEQGLLADLIANGDCNVTRENRELVNRLSGNGFVTVIDNKCIIYSRFIKDLASEKSCVINNLRLAFGNSELYIKNIKSLLELRLSQIIINNRDLMNLIENNIQDISKPAICLGQFRNICDLILNIIFSVELPDRNIPSAWTDEWRKLQRDREPFSGQIPANRGEQVHLLKKMMETGKLKKITQTTFTLTYSIYNIGNYGQHILNPEEIKIETVAPYCLIAIELCSRLCKEIKL